MSQHTRFVRFTGHSAFFALAIGLAVPAVAQDAPPSSSDTEAPTPGERDPNNEEIVVTGTRAALQSAIDRKKNADTIVDSVVAEDISDFPDKNVGEALQRITGVQLTRDFGEGAQVSIRGVEPDLNRVEINGATTLGQNGEGQRGADFRELAAELVKSIDVYKGYTVDMTEGGVGGTVSIKTRRPLELSKPLLSLTGSMQYFDLDKSWKPRGNITGATKFLDGRLGVMVNVTYDRNSTRQDSIRNTNWTRFSDNADLVDLNNDNVKLFPNPNFEDITTPQECSAISSGLPDGQNRKACFFQFSELIPKLIRNSSSQRQDERFSGVGTIQYQVTDNFDVYVEYQQNRREMIRLDNHFLIDTQRPNRLANAENCTAETIPEADRCVIDENGYLIEFTTAPTATSPTKGAGKILQLQNRYSRSVQDSRYLSGGFNWVGDGFRIEGMGVKSKGITRDDAYFTQLNASVPSIRIKIDPENGNPSFTFPDNFNPNDPDSYLVDAPAGNVSVGQLPIVGEFTFRPKEVDVSEDQYKLDADFDIEHPILSSIETGLQYRRSKTLRYTGGINATGSEVPNADGVIIPTPYISADIRLGQNYVPLPGTPSGSQVGNIVWTQEMFQDFLQNATGFVPGTFFQAGDRAGLSDTWLTPDALAAVDYVPELQQYLNRDRVREVNGLAQIPNHDVTEQIWAAYVKGNFEIDPFGIPVVGNFGVRYTRTEDVSVGFRRVTLPGQSVVSGDLIRIKNSYDDWLPAFNVAASFVPDQLVARFGVARVLARPKPTDLSPNFTCNEDPDLVIPNCSGGNPDLKPYRAWQYDLNLSWYPNQDTMLSAALFYKDIDSFIVGPVTIGSVDIFGDGTLYDVRQKINGQGAKVKGLELTAQTAFTFLPAPFDGLGFQANYTYTDPGETGLFDPLTGGPLGFPGLSKHSYNLIGYYDKGPINLRVAYNSRSSYLINPDSSDNAIVRDGTGYLDAKATFRLKRPYNMSLFIEGKNLTRETERDTVSGVPILMTNYSYAGRRFFVGASIRF